MATCILLFCYNEPELGVGIDPDMALIPLPSSIGQGSNPRPSDCELSALPLDHSFRLWSNALKVLNVQRLVILKSSDFRPKCWLNGTYNLFIIQTRDPKKVAKR